MILLTSEARKQKVMQFPSDSCYTCLCGSPEYEKAPIRTTWREGRREILGERGEPRGRGEGEREQEREREREMHAFCS